MTGEPLGVLVAAAGAGWEPLALQELDADSSLRLARRCLDVAELLAVAPTTGAGAAVVDVGLAGLDADAVHTLAGGGVRVVGVGDPDRCAAIGVDVVGEPGRLAAALADARAPEASSEPARGAAPLVAVWGPTGAPGRSTVALALADAASRAGQDTVLVDADTYGGAQAQALAVLDDVSGLMAACRAVNRDRGGDVDQHLLAVHERLWLLSGLPRADMWSNIRRGALERVVDALSASHDLVVADTGFGLEGSDGVGGAGRNQATLSLLEAADRVVVVGRADPVGLTRLVRGLHDLRDLGVTAPVVVLNRVRRAMGWDERELRATVGRLADVEPAALLPDDAATLDAALLRGRVPHAVAPSSPLVRGIDALAADLAVR